jgi:hypothetical protein
MIGLHSQLLRNSNRTLRNLDCRMAFRIGENLALV